jgi:hypothetical protein
MNEQKPIDECCPKFDPAPWENKDFVWNNKLFIKDSLPQFLHMPWPPMVGKVITRMWDRAQKAGAAPDNKDVLMLAYDPSPWKSEFFLSVTKEVLATENAKLSGRFITRVFDGPYNAVPKWIAIMDKFLAEQDKKALKYYFYYTSCPKCAKKYGHNYVVVFAQYA